ncbi:MAG TPA: FAD-dependent monooxygenase, partial [Sandaracinaceae bacterium LLY-WYZ-13_1]|nr:FAD-dependent monooxygenase [Sandaracinaceae bacterium LLY-WYZ-13_1]
MTDVIVVGAGPVGLFLGLRLCERGLRPRLLERRAGARGESRSIGIHPPALERLDRLGVGRRLVERG